MSGETFTRRREGMLRDRFLFESGTRTTQAGCWAVEPPTSDGHDPRLLDNQFTINLFYNDFRDGEPVEICSQFTLESSNCRDVIMTEELSTIVKGWLKELGVVDVSNDDYMSSWDTIVYTVHCGMHQLLKEVESHSRISLAMNLYIELRNLFSIPENSPSRHQIYDEDEDEWMEEALNDPVYMELMRLEQLDREEQDYYYDEMEEDEEEEEEEEEMVASKEDMEEFLRGCGVRFSKNNCWKKVDGCCPVCLEEVGVEVALLPCSHILHRDCLVSWVLKGRPVCPLCRTVLQPASLRN